MDLPLCPRSVAVRSRGTAGYRVVKGAFWVVVAWSMISNFSSLMGGWMGFFISIGMVEEHLLR